MKENGCQDCGVSGSKQPMPVPTIHIELSDSSDVTGYEPEKLNRVDKPLLRTPRVAGNNTLQIHHDDSITYGSPKASRRRHNPVERTLSADSYRSRPMSDSRSPAVSIRSSRASSVDRSRMSSSGGRSADRDYVDDFDESSDIEEGCNAYYYL